MILLHYIIAATDACILVFILILSAVLVYVRYVFAVNSGGSDWSAVLEFPRVS